MSNLAQIESALKEILEEQAPQLARETGFIERERNLSGADFAQTLICGWLQEPQITLDGLSQLAQIREVTISAPGCFTASGRSSARTAIVSSTIDQPHDTPTLSWKNFSTASNTSISGWKMFAGIRSMVRLWRPGLDESSASQTAYALGFALR